MQKIVPPSAVLIPEKAQKVFEGIIYTVYHWEQERFDGTHSTFEMLKRPDTMVVIGIVDNKLLVIEDTQSHAGTKIGFPGGRVEPYEGSTLAAAQREMSEETGYSFNNWRLIEVSQPFVKIEWFVHCYVAWDVSRVGQPETDPGEKITVKQLAFDEVLAWSKKDVGYLGEARDILEQAKNLRGLLALPEFKGQQVDR